MLKNSVILLSLPTKCIEIGCGKEHAPKEHVKQVNAQEFATKRQSCHGAQRVQLVLTDSMHDVCV